MRFIIEYNKTLDGTLEVVYIMRGPGKLKHNDWADKKMREYTIVYICPIIHKPYYVVGSRKGIVHGSTSRTEFEVTKHYKWPKDFMKDRFELFL